MTRTSFSNSLQHPLKGWLAVLLLLAAATALGFGLDHHVSLTSQAMVYVLAVVIAAYRLHWVESVVCAVGAVTAFNFFFVPPRWTFEVESQEHLIALFTMLGVALVISRLAAGLRRETDIAQTNERRARQLQALATTLSEASTPQAIAEVGRQALHEAFGRACTVALQAGDGHLQLDDPQAVTLEDGLACCIREAAVLGPGTGRWPGLNAWYLPLGEPGRYFGAVCVPSAEAADHAGREHAQALCTLLGQAMWRHSLSASMLSAQNEAQRQQLQSTFLAAISHDLRTPLAAVVGAASALQTQRDKLDAGEQDRLLNSIVNEASYLSTITENTLQLVRMASATQDIRMDWQAMEEIVGTVLVRVRQRDRSRRVRSHVPQELPLIKVDPVLLAQLLDNLLDNALKYSEDVVDLTVNVADAQLRLQVKDRGQGIDDARLQAIFEPYARDDRSGQRGAGLGLAVCQAIAKAHGGKLSARRRQGGGSAFTLSLPVPTEQPAGAIE